MSRAAVRVGVGTRFSYDGEVVEVVELASTQAGGEVVLKDGRGRLLRLAVKELLLSDRARIIPGGPGPASDDPQDVAAVVLGQMDDAERERVLGRAAHVREVLTGFRSGSEELAAVGEPCAPYAAGEPMESRYAAKAAELGVAARTVKRWASAFRRDGEAGLVPADNAVLAQTGRRTTRLDMRSFELKTDQGRAEWRQLLLALEQRLVLSGKYQGMLADDLFDYLFIRSSGHIGSLMTLINRGCQRAARTGAERLDEELLSRVKIDQAAHLAQDDVRNLLKGQRSRRPRRQAVRR